jgi:hypothetical protein
MTGKRKTDYDETERQLREGKIDGAEPLNRNIAFLLTIGFRLAGHWQQGGAAGLVPALDPEMAKERGVLYAFASREDGFGQERVHYIGKTTKTLASRMRDYRKPDGSQRTDVKVHAEIAKLLAAYTRVDILILGEAHMACEPLNYCGLKVSLAAGLEDSLIGEMDPPWNKLGRRSSRID